MVDVDIDVEVEDIWLSLAAHAHSALAVGADDEYWEQLRAKIHNTAKKT